jgi:hypothetical protein
MQPRRRLLITSAVASVIALGGMVYLFEVVSPIPDPVPLIGETYPDRNCAVRWYTAEIDKEAADDLRFGYIEARSNGTREAKFYDFLSGIAVITDSQDAARIGTPYVTNMEEHPMQIHLPNDAGKYDVEIFIQKKNRIEETVRRSVELEEFQPTC